MYIGSSEVPTEVVDMIVAYIIADDMPQAWKLRGVCTTFRDVITDNIVMLQPGDVFRRAGQRIALELLPKILFCRLTHRLDAFDTLPCAMLDMLTFLHQELDIEDLQEKHQYKTDLCSGMIHILGISKVRQLLWDDDSSLRIYSRDAISATLADKLVAAMAVGAHRIVSDLLTQLPESQFQLRLWEESPLVAAASLPGDEMLRTIIAYLESMKNTKVKWSATDLRIVPAMRIVLGSDKLELLLRYLQTSGLRGAKDEYNDILMFAVKAKHASAVSTILRHTPSGVKVVSDVFNTACKSRNLQVVNILLEEGEISINQGTVHTMPLNQAIKCGDTAIVGCVLDAGADINNTTYLTSNTGRQQRQGHTPLRFATMRKKSRKLIQLLIERGAK